MDQSLVGRPIGPYVVQGLLGVGGMGAVYRGRDSRLGRDVAIKILPPQWVADPERRARFDREARVLASLNHPHIGQIYGIEENAGTPALVLELVEGPTLAERLSGAADRRVAHKLPIAEALTIARQIADALDAAHERGIVHRDLKPENIKLTADGRVKVLDFGLAKAELRDEVAPGLSLSPTELHGTLQGSLLGTAAYMSPEQARGLPVDKRADIWAFGCVLYEMLAGRQAYPGSTMSDRVVAILDREPAWDALPAATPPAVRRTLRRCLEKDVKQRLRDIGDARFELDEALAGQARDSGVVAGGRRAWRAPQTMAAVVVAAIVAGATAWLVKPAPKSNALVRAGTARLVVMPAEPLAESEEAVALSPDGRRVAYIGGSQNRRIFVRDIDQFESTPVPGTEGAEGVAFSPDGRSLAFIADRKLKKVTLAGGAPLTLRDSVLGRGLDWTADDSILFNPGVGTGIWRVRSGGDTPTAVTKTEPGEDQHRYPAMLPGGRAVLFSAFSGGGIAEDQIYVQLLDTGQRRALGKGVGARYIATGHLVYVRGGSLLAAPFDLDKLELKGQPVGVLEGVRQTPVGTPQISFSRDSSIVYVSAGHTSRDRDLVWVDPSGTEQPAGASDRSIAQPRVTADDRRVAVAVKGEPDLWQYDFARETWTRLTFDGSSSFPLWTPDGRRITFSSGKAGPYNIYWKTTDGSGSEERLVVGERPNYPLSWSPDGRMLAYVSVSGETAQDIWLFDSREPAKPRLFLQTRFREGAPAFSPDGRWLAYVSDESGRPEVYVRPVPGPGEKWTISAGGGGEPVWPRNGHQLFYRSGDAMMVVDVSTQPIFSAGKPRRLFEKPYARSSAFWANYDVSADGKRLLMIKGDERGAAKSDISVVVNWFDELKERVPVASR